MSTQADVFTPLTALMMLKEGNERFVANQTVDRDLPQQIQETKSGQSPFAVVLGCIDSRVPPELVFDQGIGDIFTIRIAGNIINEDILGSIEFSCKVVGVKLILVLGHTNCGAVRGACDGVEMGHLTTLVRKLKPAVDAVSNTAEDQQLEDGEFVNEVARKNVQLTIDDIQQQSPLLAEMVEQGEIEIVGGMYDVGTGRVTFF